MSLWIFVNGALMSRRQPIYAVGSPRLQKIGTGRKWLPTMNYHRGDIVLVLFPDSNLRTAKRRPALVVQADQLSTGLPQTIVAMITSNMARAGHPSRVVVRLNSESANRPGLLTDSVIMTDNLATIHDSEIDRAIGAFQNTSELDAALRATLPL
jgi:mRNA interferase MazF